MRKSIILAAALTSGLLLTASVQTLSAAGASSNLTNIPNTTDGLVELVRGGGSGHSAMASSGGRTGHSGGGTAMRSSHVSGGSAGDHRSASHRGNGRFNNGRYGYGYGGYGGDCSWLRSYSWARYEACVGIY